MTICERCISDHGIFPSTVSASYGIFGIISIDSNSAFWLRPSSIISILFNQQYMTKQTASAEYIPLRCDAAAYYRTTLRIGEPKQAFGYGHGSIGGR